MSAVAPSLVSAWARCALAFLVAMPLIGATALPARAQGPKLDRATLTRIKEATVLLKVQLPNGSKVSGSGFFVHQAGLIATNAHVLGMLEADSRRPLQIDVVVHSGTPRAQTLRGRLLGVDRDTDLAVLRVEGKALPAPLALGPTADLMETQDLYVFGFPFGEALGKAITVSRTSVSSLRKVGTTLRRIQVNGGMHPGNSGGPVTDTAGRVVGVAVSGVRNTTIHFAVPSDAVTTFLIGRPVRITRDAAFRDGKTIKQMVGVHFIDPLSRVSKVTLEYWTGPAGKGRPGGPAEPKLLPGDSPKQVAVLAYDKKERAQAEITLPTPADAKHVYWMRAVVTDVTGKTSWTAAFGQPLRMLLERKAVVLKYKPVPGALNLVTLTSRSFLKLRAEDDSESSVRMNLELGLRELLAKESEDNRSRFRLAYHRWSIGLFVDNKLVKGSEEVRKLFQQNLPKLINNVELGPDGDHVSAKADISRVPREAQEMIGDVNEQALQSLEVLVAPLPGGVVRPMQTWKGQRLLEIGPMGMTIPAQADLVYTYRGLMNRIGKMEALIEVKGALRGQRNNTNIGGSVQGLLWVSLETGQVVNGNVTLKVDMDLVVRRKAVKANGEMALNLRREALLKKK